MQLRLIQADIRRDPAAAEARVTTASDELARSLEELRELARGLHPAVLEHGLALGADVAGGALGGADRGGLRRSARCRGRSSSRSTSWPARRWPTSAKYAQATTASVRLSRTDGGVAIEIADDGVGGARATAAPGLRGLPDRVEALAGHLLVTSPAGAGTVVTRGAAVRVVIADDNLLMREGIASLAAARGDRGRGGGRRRATSCCARSTSTRPDAAIVDVRMPPTHTDEGLRAAHDDPRPPPADRAS